MMPSNHQVIEASAAPKSVGDLEREQHTREFEERLDRKMRECVDKVMAIIARRAAG